MKAELSAHFSWSMPPYRTARPGMLCRPTKVAAANCQALFPVSSHCGDGTSAISFSPLSLCRWDANGRDEKPQKLCHLYPIEKYTVFQGDRMPPTSVVIKTM